MSEKDLLYFVDLNQQTVEIQRYREGSKKLCAVGYYTEHGAVELSLDQLKIIVPWLEEWEETNAT